MRSISIDVFIGWNMDKKRSNTSKTRVKAASNQCIAMVLGVGGVYNSRVLLGPTKTSQKSISCVYFAPFGADVGISCWRKVTGSNAPMVYLQRK
jgi:hypothetical protein